MIIILQITSNQPESNSNWLGISVNEKTKSKDNLLKQVILAPLYNGSIWRALLQNLIEMTKNENYW